MLVYYLEEAKPKKFSTVDSPIYYNGRISCDAEPWTHHLRNALFYTTAEEATKDIPIANEWWCPHDFRVKSIELEKVIGSATQFKFSYIGDSYEERRSNPRIG